MSDEAKEKIRQLQQADIPIAERRALYNQMARRMKNKSGLPAGLVEKYAACQSQKKERFNLLKEFIVDENMSGTQYLATKLHWSSMFTVNLLGPASWLRATL